MKANPLMAAIFAIILLLTFVVMLRSAVGAPEVHEAPHAKEETHESKTEENQEEAHTEENSEEKKDPQDEAPAH